LGFATFLFTVKDTGIGMSEELLKKIYEPFSREKTSTVSHIQGTGLGMSIVKNLVDMLGGRIDIHSKLGEGTRFDVIVDFEIDDSLGGDKDGDTSICNEVSFKGLRALLVEDNEMNREIVKDVLEDRGLIVDEATDGDEAVEMIRQIADKGEYDYYCFVLMDIQMPRLNGYDATRQIRELLDPKDVHIPIIAMTANAFEEDRRNAFAAGMDEHLAKPFDVNKLFDTLARYI